MKLSSTKIAFCLFTLLAWSFDAHANREEIVTGRHGGIPYLVVVEGDGTSTKQAGVYKRDLKNDWTPIALGKVAVLDRIGGYIHQLELSEITKRADAFAVIDGKVVFFSAESSIENAASKMTINHLVQEGSLQVYLNKNSGPVAIPAISSGEDFSYYQKMMRDPGSQKNLQVIVFSIRSPNPMGPGVTFSLVFDVVTENGKVSLKTVSKPVVLEWDFIDSVTLNQRITQNDESISFLSKGLVERYAKPRSPNENSVLKKWREGLSNFAQSLGGVSGKWSPYNADADTIPYFDIVRNEIRIPSLPHVKFIIGSKTYYSIYDPAGDKSGVYEASKINNEKVDLNLMLTRQPVLQAELALDEYDGLKDPHPYSNSYFPGAFAFLLDSKKQLNVLYNSTKGNVSFSIPLKPILAKTDKVAEVSYFLVPEAKYLLLSWKFQDGTAQTEAHAFKMIGDQFRLEDSLPISSQFFTAESLEQRLHGIELDSKEVLAFDDATPIVHSEEEYKQLHRLSRAHINIEASLTKNSLVEFYPRASEEFELLETINYKIFDDASNKGRRTGVYSTEKPGPALITEVLLPKFKNVKLEDDASFVIERKKVYNSNSEANFSEYGLILTDDTFNKGNQKVELQFVLSSKLGGDSIVSNIASLTALDTIESIKSVFIPKEQGNNEQPHNIVYFIKIAGAGTLSAVIKIAPPRAQNEKYKIVSTHVNPKKYILEADESLSTEEMESRLRIDKSGTVYWIKTPEVQFTDSEFRLIDLQRNATVDPNRESLSLQSITRKEGNESSGSPWRFVGNPAYDKKTGSSSAAINPLLNQPVATSQFRTDMFSEFRKILEELASTKVPAKRKILIVPESLRDYALGYPLALFTRQQEKSPIWTNNGHKLRLYVADGGLGKQEEVLKNLDSMRSAAQDPSIRPVLLASLRQIASALRPAIDSSKKPFTLSEETVDTISAESAEAKSNSLAPHFLYLLATDGKHVGVEQFMKNQALQNPLFSSLLIGTESEWKSLIEDGSLEDKIDLKKHFDVVKLEAPTTETREKFVMEFLTRREIQSLNYKIDLASFLGKHGDHSLSDLEAKQVVAKYFVNRADQLSHDNKESDLVGFIKSLNTLISEIQKNTVIRNSRTIDRSTVEQILAKVFPVVLNLDILPDNDPIKRLSHKDAAWQWQQSGYGGALSFKQDIIKVILSQLVPDSVRSASSSIVVVGDSGSGKTAITRSLFVNYLNLKEYKVTATPEENEGAWYFHVSCNSIRENNASAAEIPGSIPLDAAMNHIEKFFASANGHRGFIVLDDLHLAPPKVRDILISKMRYILENPTMPVAGGETIPTRNITQIVTLNYANQHLLQKISPSNFYNPTVLQRILASLSHNDKIYDDSLLKRVGKVVVLDSHPQDAKSPQLRAALVEATKSTFNNSKVLNFVSSDAITDIAKQFPKADARTFTSTAVANLVQLNQSRGSLVIVTPKLTISSVAQQSRAENPPLGGDNTVPVRVEQDVPKEIEKFIQTNVEIIPIEKTQRGHIEFLKYMADSVRKYTFESLLKALNEDPRFAGSLLGQQAVGAPSAKALFDHLESIPYFPMKEVNVDPAKLNAKSANEKNQFRRIWSAILLKQSQQDLQIKVANPPLANIFNEFTTSHTPVTGNRSRQHVLKESMSRIMPLVSKVTASLMRVNDVYQLPAPNDWLANLNRNEVNLVQLAGTELANELAKYIQEMAEANLIENQRESAGKTDYKITQYDTIRLYAMVIDKAIASLPWEAITVFMIHNLDYATKNLAQGHNPYLQHFLFETKQSVLKSIDATLVTGHARSMPLFDNVSASDPGRLDKNFRENCMHLLSKSLLE